MPPCLSCTPRSARRWPHCLVALSLLVVALGALHVVAAHKLASHASSSSTSTVVHARNLATTACTSDNDCGGSSQGTCLAAGDMSSGVCACLPGFLGADCSISSQPTRPIHSYLIHGLAGQQILQEWFTALTSAGTPYLQIRWTVNTKYWFGGIFNVGTDGMTSGDCWCYWVSTSSPYTAYLTDYFSSGLTQPNIDSQQDLTIVHGWRNSTWQTIEFTRKLTTGDTNDIAFNTAAGTPVRFMWTMGLSAPNGNANGGSRNSAPTVTSNSTAMPQLSMHGYIGDVGQLKVDFVGGTMQELTDGVAWPDGYQYAALVVLIFLIAPIGLVTQRDSVKTRQVGRWLRLQPLRFAKGKEESESPATRKFNAVTLQFFPAIVGCSNQELFAVCVYIVALVASIVKSTSDYNDVGRSWLYVFGHLTAMHMALSLLPVSRNSALLWLFNVGFDTAVTWHRRIGVASILFMLIHLVTMVIVWSSPTVLFSTTAIQFGITGLTGTLSFLCFLVVLFSSVDHVRRNHWEWFFYCHIIFVSLGYVGALLHSVTLRWLLIVPGGLFLIDVALRHFWNPVVRYGGAITGVPTGTAAVAADSKLNKARLVQLDCFGQADSPIFHDHVVALTLRLDSTANDPTPLPEAGSHVYLRVPVISHLEHHPFTISLARQIKRGALVSTFIQLHVQALKAGPTKLAAGMHSDDHSWTQKLYGLVRRAIPAEHTTLYFDGFEADPTEAADEAGDEENGIVIASHSPLQLQQTAPFTLTLDGPYMSLNLPLLRYPVLVLIGGGIGVTPCMALLSRYLDMLEAEERDKSAVANEAASSMATIPLRVFFLWTARNESSFRQWFPRQLKRAARHPARVHLQLYSSSPVTPRASAIDVRAAAALPAAWAAQSQQTGHAGGVELVSIRPAVAVAAHSAVPVDDEVAVEVVQSPDAESSSPPPPLHIIAASKFDLPVVRRRPAFDEYLLGVSKLLPATCTANDVVVFSCGRTSLTTDVETEAANQGFHFTHEAFEF